MLQRLTECVYQRKAKTAEHLNLYKVFCTSVVYLGITNTWLNCVHFQVTVLVQRPLMKECLYLAWRQKNWCHCPSLNIRCLFLSNGSLWRRAFILLEDRKCIDVQLNTCSRCYVVIETCTQNDAVSVVQNHGMHVIKSYFLLLICLE